MLAFYNKFIILFQQFDNDKIIIFISENIKFYYAVIFKDLIT